MNSTRLPNNLIYAIFVVCSCNLTPANNRQDIEPLSIRNRVDNSRFPMPVGTLEQVVANELRAREIALLTGIRHGIVSCFSRNWRKPPSELHL